MNMVEGGFCTFAISTCTKISCAGQIIPMEKDQNCNYTSNMPIVVHDACALSSFFYVLLLMEAAKNSPTDI